jgi:hypothetical protein
MKKSIVGIFQGLLKLEEPELEISARLLQITEQLLLPRQQHKSVSDYLGSPLLDSAGRELESASPVRHAKPLLSMKRS